MLLTITCTESPATDLGFLLHKHPSRVQTFPLTFGAAHVFYPEATEPRCTAVLLLDVDPVHLVRGRRHGEEAYVSDRPYVASSLLSVAIAEVFGTALSGRCELRPDLATRALSLRVSLPAVPCKGGEAVLRDLFEPLGYQVEARRIPLDEEFPEWGEGRLHAIALEARRPLHEVLSHLYVLLPVLDDGKHYWIAEAEVEKLLRHGEGWLASHPRRELIARRYLRYRGGLVRAALSLLQEEEPEEEDDDATEPERREGLSRQRVGAVLAVLKGAGARRVLDLGCGDGRLLDALLDDASFAEVVGVDASPRMLEIAASRLRLDRLPEARRARIRLLHGSLVYRDARLAGFDAAAVVEVVEHLDTGRLAAFERVLFEFARPGLVVLTTPNAEYNKRFENLGVGALRHPDHRFEWTRAQLQEWARGVAGHRGYAVRFLPVGSEDPALGAPTQMALFTREGP